MLSPLRRTTKSGTIHPQGVCLWYAIDSKIGGLVYRRLPEYFKCLNVCKSMEEHVKPIWGKYVKQLNILTDPACATAAHRAEAFGLTINLWQPGE